MTKDWDVVTVLRHYRHDWLNKLQLIKGNLDIGRVEKVKGIIDEVISQSRNESDLSNMKTERLAQRLLTFNWEEHPYVLLYEVLTENNEWRTKENVIIDILDNIFLILDQCVKYGENNQLLIVFKDITEMELEIDFHGQIKEKENWPEKMNQFKLQFQSIIKSLEWNENGCFMEITFSKH